MARVDPDLVKAVREGTYVVDPHAVAGAILRRHRRHAEAEHFSGVLEALERDSRATGVAEDDAASRADVA